MSIATEIIDALESLEADNLDAGGNQMVLILPSNAQIPCVPSSEEVGTEIQVGPQVETIQAMVHVRKSYFVDASNTVITVDSDVILADNSTGRPRSAGGAYRTGGFRGKTYRVLKVTEDPAGCYFRVYMGSAR